jgi:outer membrane autotransporter protein
MTRSLAARAGSLALNSASALLTGAAVLTVFAPFAHAETGDGNWYFFGDSNVGQGNFSAIVGSRGEDFYPNSSNNGFERDSNGFIWAEMMGRDVDIILDPDIDSPNINFGISGAHMDRGGDLVPYGIETGVRVQTESFAGLVGQGAIAVGEDDVAFMIAGANDFLDRLAVDDPADEIIADVASAAAANVLELANVGVKTIILSEIQPLQFAPDYADEPEVQAALAELVEVANAEMFAAIEAAGLPDDVNLVTMKYKDFITYVTSHGNALGFSNTTEACYREDEGTLCAPDFAGQNTHLWFDELHMTESGHRLAAQWWLATLNGASGQASRQTGRMPRIAYEQMESHRGLVRPGTHAGPDQRFAAWLSPVSSEMKLETAGGNPSAKLDLDGAVFGMERRFAEHFILGGALSVGKTEALFNDGGRYRMEGGAVSLYTALDYQEEGRLSLSVTKGGHDITGINRVTGVDLLSAGGETESSYWDVELAARTTDKIGVFEVDHGMSLSTGRISVDGYSETGAAGLALAYEKQAFNYQCLGLDAVVRGPAYRLTETVSIAPVADVAYAWQFGDDDYRVTSQLIGNTAQAVSVRSQAPAEDRFDVGVGFQLGLGARWTVSARYAQKWASDITRADESMVSLRMAF